MDRAAPAGRLSAFRRRHRTDGAAFEGDCQASHLERMERSTRRRRGRKAAGRLAQGGIRRHRPRNWDEPMSKTIYLFPNTGHHYYFFPLALQAGTATADVKKFEEREKVSL